MNRNKMHLSQAAKQSEKIGPLEVGEIGMEIGIHKSVDEIFADIEASTKNVPADMAERRGPFLLFNGNGSKAPLFWCFNNWV